MKKIFGFLIGVQTIALMTTVAIPVQAAIKIGAPLTLSGSVVTLRNNVPVTTQVTPVLTTSAPATQTTVTTPITTSVQTSTSTQSQSIKIGQSTSSGNVVSLKNIVKQPTSIPVTVTSPVTTTASSTIPTASSTIPTAPTTPTTTLPVVPSLTVITANEQKMIDMINQERIAVGVKPVKLDLRLAAVGRAKANDMIINNYFSHTSPTYGSPWAMMQQVGLTVSWAGENIALNKSVENAMAGFMQSPGHRANILDPRFTHVGIGIAGNIYVQEFLQEK